MPIPQPTGNREEWVYSTCVPFLTDEGMTREQAVAVCNDHWDKRKYLKSRTWDRLERIRLRYERKFKPVFQKALDDQIKPILSEIQFINASNTELQDVEIDNEPIKKAYKKLYYNVALDYAQRQRDKILKENKGKFQIKLSEDDIWMSLIASDIDSYLLTGFVGENIAIVGDTSKEILQKMINDLIAEINEGGITGTEAQTLLRDRLESQWHKEMRYRVERIVRTETTAASNWGTLKGVQSTGIPHNKTWVATPGARIAHADASGQTVNINHPFIVDGEELMFPGDPSASAGNIINCRCAMTYSIQR